MNARGNVALTIEGPVCGNGGFFAMCGSEVEFKILNQQGEIGIITKEGKGYRIHFPVTFDVSLKATLLGACLLIQYNLKFEKELRQALQDEMIGS